MGSYMESDSMLERETYCVHQHGAADGTQKRTSSCRSVSLDRTSELQCDGSACSQERSISASCCMQTALWSDNSAVGHFLPAKGCINWSCRSGSPETIPVTRWAHVRPHHARTRISLSRARCNTSAKHAERGVLARSSTLEARAPPVTGASDIYTLPPWKP